MVQMRKSFQPFLAIATILLMVVAVSEATRPCPPLSPSPSTSVKKPTAIASGSGHIGPLHGHGTTTPLTVSVGSGKKVSASVAAGPPTTGSFKVGSVSGSGTHGPPMEGCLKVDPTGKLCLSMGPPMNGKLKVGKTEISGKIKTPINGNDYLPPIRVPGLTN